MLSYQDDFDVVGPAGDAQEAIEQVRTLDPDLVLMDIDLRGEDGVSALRRIKVVAPETTVVMLTVYDDMDKLLDAVKAGAQGYLIKDIRSVDLLAQLRGLAQGEAALSRRMATRMLEEFRQSSIPAEPEADLTNREREVLELVAARLVNKEIAARLVISEYTVKNRLKNILAKLQLPNRRQAAAYGMARGWFRPGNR